MQKRITSIIRGKSGAVVLLADVANVVETPDPNQINRENVARRIVVSRNAQGRDLGCTDKAIQESIAMDVLPSLPEGYSASCPGDSMPGAVVAIQTFGDLLSYHPYLHILITDGCFRGDNEFTRAPAFDWDKLEELFKKKISGCC